MNPLLLWAYLGATATLALGALLIAHRGATLLPRRWSLLLGAYFALWTCGVGTLLASELTAPFGPSFYLSPFLFMAYMALLSAAFLALFLLVVDMGYRHLTRLPWMGGAALAAILALISASFLMLERSSARGYPWTFYLAVECAMGLGIATFALMAYRSFQDSREAVRLSTSERRGFAMMGVLGVLGGGGLFFYGGVLPFVHYSSPFDPTATIVWLYMVGGSAIALLVLLERVRRLIVLI